MDDGIRWIVRSPNGLVAVGPFDHEDDAREYATGLNNRPGRAYSDWEYAVLIPPNSVLDKLI